MRYLRAILFPVVYPAAVIAYMLHQFWLGLVRASDEFFDGEEKTRQ